jgi:mono/diheme cytochrome c family protein
MKNRAAILAAIYMAPVYPAAAQTPAAAFSNLDSFASRDGAAIYSDVCAACHMPDGRGARGAGAYPALAGNSKLAAADYAVSMVLNGRGAMPPFANWLDDQQIAAVVNFIRSHFGNSYTDAVAVSSVHAARATRGSPR